MEASAVHNGPAATSRPLPTEAAPPLPRLAVSRLAGYLTVPLTAIGRVPEPAPGSLALLAGKCKEIRRGRQGRLRDRSRNTDRRTGCLTRSATLSRLSGGAGGLRSVAISDL